MNHYIAVICATFMICCISPCRAGYFALSEGTGWRGCEELSADYMETYDSMPVQTFEFSWDGDQPDNGFADGNGDINTASGHAWPVFEWVPSGPDDAEPTTIYVLVHAYGQAYDIVSFDADNNPSTSPGSVSDGFGDASSYTPTPNYSIFLIQGMTSVEGWHLVQTQTTGQYTTVQLPQMSFTGGIAADESDTFASNACTIDASVDTRGLTISAGVDPTYFKEAVFGGYVDSDGDPEVYAAQHARNSDGSMDGDIGLDFGVETDGDEAAPYGTESVSYTATPSGTWATIGSTDSWTSSLKGGTYTETLSSEDDTIQTFTQEYCKPGYDNGTPASVVACDTGHTDTVTCTYTNGSNAGTPYATASDGDGASATGMYKMKIHQTAEIYPSNKTSSRLDEPLSITPDSPGYASKDGSINCTWNAPGALWGIGEGAASVLSNAPWPDAYNWLGVLIAAAGLAATDLSPKADSGAASFDDCWYATSNPQPPTFADQSGAPISQPDASEMGNFHMLPHAMAGYNPTWYLKDSYGMGGFTGETKVYTAKYTGVSYWWGQFVQVNSY